MKRITERTLEQYTYMQAPLYSPDGKYIAFKIIRADYDGNCYHHDLCTIKGKDVKQVTSGGDAKQFCWTEDGKLLFPAVREAEHKEAIKSGERITPFYTVSPEGGETALAFVAPFADVKKFLPLKGGKFAVLSECRIDCETKEDYLRMEEIEMTYYACEELPFYHLNMGVANNKRNYLFVYDPKSGSVDLVNRPLENVIRFSADERGIVYSATEHENTVESWDVSINVYEYEEKNLKCIMPTGKLICRNHEVYGELWGDKVIVMGSEGKTYGRTESMEMWLADRETGEMSMFCKPEYNIAYRNIISDHFVCPGMMKPAGDRLYFTNTIKSDTYIRYMDKEGSWSELLTEDGSVEAFDVYGENICHNGFHGYGMQEIYVNNEQITHFNDFLLKEYSVCPPEKFTFTDKDGWEIEGWVMKPAGYEPGKKYPGILDIHGGPRAAMGSIFFHENQVHANAGYFVFFCNPRGSEGGGDEFADVWGKIGTIDYDDLMQFTDEVLKRYPDLDASRLGVQGGSYGGIMTNWIIGHTDRFAAASSQRSMCNWITGEHATQQGYTWTPNFERTTVRSGGFEKMWNDSGLKYACKSKTPILFICADEDHESCMIESMQMYTAVKLAGTPARLCMFRDETHDLSRSGRPHGRIARMEEIHRWMDLYLKPASELKK